MEVCSATGDFTLQEKVMTEQLRNHRLHTPAGVAWSSVEPWVFASISYDGRVAINRVPSQVKYKILI